MGVQVAFEVGLHYYGGEVDISAATRENEVDPFR
jgi:hypothetical protein